MNVKDANNVEVEHEAKNLLSKEQFERLFAYFACKPSDRVQQSNLYLDNKNKTVRSLQPAGATLRIRSALGKEMLEFKVPLWAGGASEYRQPLNRDEYANAFCEGVFPPGEVKDALYKHRVYGPFLVLGKADTLRIKISNDHWGVEISLDETTYHSGTVDYEIKVEGKTMEHVEMVINEILKIFLIPRVKALKKIERFYNSLITTKK